MRRRFVPAAIDSAARGCLESSFPFQTPAAAPRVCR